MNCHQVRTLAALLTVIGLFAITTQAAERTSPAPVSREPSALSPAQLSAIRGVSRNVLAAKKSGIEDGADADQLARLRSTVDQLIAADVDPRNRTPITVQGKESDEQRDVRDRVSRLRDTSRADARAVAAQLRQRGEVKAAHARRMSEDDTRSAGLPVGAQRARLFERWAQKLDAALADDNADRTTELRALREQLGATHGSLSDAPITHGTPTLQAMPADYAPTKINGASKQQGR